MAPRVSVIIPTHNREALVGKAVGSALGQTFADVEVLVVDDGSTDATAERLAALRGDPRLRVLRRPHASGRPAVARNEGIAQASGEFVAFLDDDDAWYSHKLAEQVAFLDAHPRHALVASRCRFVGDDDQIWPPMAGAPFDFKSLIEANYVGCSMAVVRAEALRQVGGFDPSLIFAEDWDLWLRLAERHPFFVLPSVLGDYLVHPGGISRNRLRELRGVVQMRTALRRRNPGFSWWIEPRLRADRRALAQALWARGERAEALRVRGWR